MSVADLVKEGTMGVPEMGPGAAAGPDLAAGLEAAEAPGPAGAAGPAAAGPLAGAVDEVLASAPAAAGPEIAPGAIRTPAGAIQQNIAGTPILPSLFNTVSSEIPSREFPKLCLITLL